MRRYISTCLPFVCIFAAALPSCGKKSNRTISTTDTATADNASDLVQEAVDSAGAGESSTTVGFVGDALNFSAKPTVPTVTRACAVSGATAAVTITGDIGTNTTTISRPKATGTRTMTGTMTETRTWSKAGATVACSSTTGHAVPSGGLLNATVVIDSTRTRLNTTDITFTNAKTKAQTVVNHSVTNSVKGNRTVTWTAADDTLTLANHTLRIKTVASDVTRTITKDAAVLEWNIKTATNSPLTIKVDRLTADGSLVSKTITGTLISSNTTEPTRTIEKTFTSFVMTHTGDECAPTSGTLSISFKTSGTETEKVDCTVDSGDLSCTNKAGDSVTIDSPACDPADKI